VLGIVHGLNLAMNPSTVDIDQVFKIDKFVIGVKHKAPVAVPARVLT